MFMPGVGTELKRILLVTAFGFSASVSSVLIPLELFTTLFSILS